MRERSESFYATMIMVSIGAMVVGVVALMLGFGSGTLQLMRGHFISGAAAGVALVGAIGVLGGLGLLVFTMVSGATIGATEKRGIRKVDRNTRVIARYATNKRGEPLPLEWDFPDPDTRFYVRLLLSDGTRAEFQCVREVFDQCGEGMRGESQFQGRWLGLFKPYIGAPQP